MVEERELLEEDSTQEVEMLREETFISADEGELLVLRRLLNSHKEEDWLRHNIFRTGTVEKKVCQLIIDSGSCENVAASAMVEKLNLKRKIIPILTLWFGFRRTIN